MNTEPTSAADGSREPKSKRSIFDLVIALNKKTDNILMGVVSIANLIGLIVYCVVCLDHVFARDKEVVWWVVPGLFLTVATVVASLSLSIIFAVHALRNRGE